MSTTLVKYERRVGWGGRLMDVTEEIRAIVKEVMQERHMTQNQLAEELGVTPQALSRTLNERGKVPGLWKEIFAALGLEITVKRVRDRATSED